MEIDILNEQIVILYFRYTVFVHLFKASTERPDKRCLNKNGDNVIFLHRVIETYLYQSTLVSLINVLTRLIFMAFYTRFNSI